MTRYIEDLNENTAPVSGDYLLCYDASAGSTDKDRKVNVSKFAVLAVANTFTALQTFDIPSGANYIELASRDRGAGLGSYIQIGLNNNASTPAAGFIYMANRTGNYFNIWIDAAAELRRGTTDPTYANDLSGVVVGTQTSSLDTKNVIDEFTDQDGALATILATSVYNFTYKSGSFNGEQFTGIITDYAPTFGMDRDARHPSGKSFNEVTAFGYTVAAFKALTRRIEELERKLEK